MLRRGAPMGLFDPSLEYVISKDGKLPALDGSKLTNLNSIYSDLVKIGYSDNKEVFLQKMLILLQGVNILITAPSNQHISGRVSQPLENQKIIAYPPDDSYSLTFSSSSLPQGLNLNSTTGEITGTPIKEASGTFEVTISSEGLPNLVIVVNYSFSNISILYYGYLDSTSDFYKVSEITQDMLDSPTVKTLEATSLEKTSMGDNPAGVVLFVLIPKSLNLKVLKFDGIGGYLPFEENNGAAGTGGNGIEISIDGIPYLAYGEFALVSGETFIKTEEQ